MSKRFSWILPQKLGVGSFPDLTASVFKLRRDGVTAILSLTEDHERTVPAEVIHSFLWQKVPIPDGARGGIPTEAQFAETLEILDRWYRKGHVVFVHCLAGVGRSASVCSLYLAARKGMSLSEAIAFVKSKHAYADPDPHQIAVMQKLLDSMSRE